MCGKKQKELPPPHPMGDILFPQREKDPGNKNQQGCREIGRKPGTLLWTLKAKAPMEGKVTVSPKMRPVPHKMDSANPFCISIHHLRGSFWKGISNPMSLTAFFTMTIASKMFIDEWTDKTNVAYTKVD